MSLMHAAQTPSRRPAGTAAVMGWLLVATLPGIAALTWHFGWGVLTNVAFAAALGVGLEAAVLRLRGRPAGATLADNSALVTGVLLGASLPPGSAWWLILTGMIAAIVVAKQLYGGLGHNPFNPAMVGYAVLLVSFPVPMSLWAAPTGLIGPEALPLGEVLRQFAGLATPETLDALSGATPLDAFKHKPEGLMAAEFWAASPLPEGALTAWRQVALAWLAGGALLLYKRIIGWQIPAAMLASLALLAALLYAASPSHQGSPLFHLLGGAAVFGAFFIATDPVSAATSRRGRWLYGAGIGALVVLIRAFGGYPDAVAFAVLLMNLAAPLLDYYTEPRAYGHATATRGIAAREDDR